MTRKWQMIGLVLLALAGWLAALSTRTEAAAPPQQAVVEYNLVPSVRILTNQKSFKELGAEGWTFAGTFGAEGSTLVFMKPRRNLRGDEFVTSPEGRRIERRPACDPRPSGGDPA